MSGDAEAPASSERHRRLAEEMKSLDDDVAMHPMRIVSSEQGGSALANFAKSRVAIFVFGVIAAVVVLVLAGMVYVPQRAAPPQAAREWTVEINLFADDAYRMVSNKNASVSLRVDRETVYRTNSAQRAAFKTTRLCGANEWSYLRFLLEEWRTTDGSLRAAGRPAGRDEYALLLEEVLARHSFTAKLRHGGCVIRRDDSNIEATLRYALSAALRNETLRQHVQLPGKEPGAATFEELREHLMVQGLSTVDGLQESAYNYLLSSPASEAVSEGEPWTREIAEAGIDINVTYKITQFVTDKVKGKPLQPIVSGTPRTQVDGYYKLKGARDDKWLVIRLNSSRTLENEEARDELEDLLRNTGVLEEIAYAQFTIKSASIKTLVNGTLVVGGSTGVVRDGLVTSNSTLKCELELHPAPSSLAVGVEKENVEEPHAVRKELHRAARRSWSSAQAHSVPRIISPRVGDHSLHSAAHSLASAILHMRQVPLAEPQIVELTVRGSESEAVVGYVFSDPVDESCGGPGDAWANSTIGVARR